MTISSTTISTVKSQQKKRFNVYKINFPILIIEELKRKNGIEILDFYVYAISNKEEIDISEVKMIDFSLVKN